MTISGLNMFWVVNWSTDSNGLCDYVDPAWEEVTGQTVAAAMGKGWFETIHPDDREKTRSELNLAREETRAFKVIARLRRLDGSFRWAMSAGAPQFDEQGELRGFSGSLIDFHDRIVAEQELVETRQRLEAIMNAAPVGVSYSSDSSCEYVTGNKALFAQFELDPSENVSASALDPAAAGRQIRFFRKGRELADTELPLQVAVRERRNVDPMEIDVELPSGRRWTVEASGAPIIAPDGRLLGGVAVSADITERKKNLEALRASEARYRTLFETSRDGIVAVDMSGRIIEANPAYQQMLGYTLEELTHLTYQELTPARWHDVEAAIVREQVVPFGESAEYEKEYIRKDGGVLPISLRTWTVKDHDGTIIGMRAFVRDITERKQAERRLHDSELRYRSLVDAVSIVSWRCPASGLQVEPQPEWMAFTGQSAAEMLGDGWAKAVHPDDVEEVASKWFEAVARGALFESEFRLRRHDGEWRWMSVKVVPVRDANDAIFEWFGMNVDVTERREAEEKLRASEERLLIAQLCARAGVWDVDLVTNRVTWSEPYYELYGLPRSVEPSNENWFASIHPDDRPQCEAECKRALEARDAQRNEFRIIRDGETRWLRSEGRVICNSADQPIRVTGLTWDITERKQVEEALKQSRNDLDRAQEVGKIGWWRLDVRSNVLTWSEENHRIFGVPKGTPMSYDGFLRIVHPDDRANLHDQWQKGLRGAPYDIEHRIVVAGEIKWVREKAYLEFDDAGKLLGGFGVTQDITDRKRVEEALRESEERFRASFANAAIGFAMNGPDFTYLDVNPAYCALTGYAKDELLGLEGPTLIHPDDRPGDLDLARRMLAGEMSSFVVENRYIRKNGEEIWVRKSVSLIRHLDGAPRWIITLVEDVTERKQAELGLRESRQRLAQALEAGQLGFWDWDIPSGNVRFGGCWASMLGYENDEVEPHIGAWERLVHPDDRETIAAILSDHLEGRTDYYECEHRLRHKDGSWRWILDRGKVVEWDAAGQPLRAVGTHADVTARHEAENALQEADRRKDEFLAMLAHELRNPLAAISMSLQILRRRSDSAKIERTLDMMDRQSNHLVRLVDDLLEVSRITHGKIELRKERVDIGGIVAQAIDTCRPFIESKSQLLEIVCPSEPLALDVDPVRIAQALANLLNNAAKYMEPGGRIHLAVRQREDELLLSVRDEGPGIPVDMLPRVFDLFTQADSTIDRAQGGLGIGLALARRLVELHGGRLEARSDGPGQGCEFVIRLPLPALADKVESSLVQGA